MASTLENTCEKNWILSHVVKFNILIGHLLVFFWLSQCEQIVFSLSDGDVVNFPQVQDAQGVWDVRLGRRPDEETAINSYNCKLK